MKQNWKQRFAALLLTLCLLAGCALPALATSANIVLSRKGSIEVTLYDHQNDTALRGGKLTLYKVADVTRSNGDLKFSYTEDFKGCGIALGDLTDSTLAARLEAKLPAGAQGTTRTVSEEGTAAFTKLPLGLYLVVQTEASKGYEAVNSFLVSLPMADESGWLYTVDASPKVGSPTGEYPPQEPDTPTTPEKPDKPATPDQPDTPDTPDTSKPTDTPQEPALPGRPTGSGSSDGSGSSSGLPQSGQLNWPIPVMACSGLLLFAAGWVLNKKETAL